MKWTPYQKEILSCQTLGKIIYRKMWLSERKLGYGNKGTSEYYEVNIASDVPTLEIKDLILLHEVGHIYFHHLDIDITEEIKNIKYLFDKLNKPFSLIRKYGGPCRFINLAMDLEINSKVYTLKNLNTLNNFFSTFNSCPFTIDHYNLELEDNFRDYYIPLIQRLEEDLEEENLDSQDVPFDLNPSSFEDSDIQEEVEQEAYEFKESKEKEDMIGSMEEILEENLLQYKESPEISIYNFLSKILKKMTLEYQRDALKNYNRGTRKNENGILYSSKRRKVAKGKRKICFILDVSPSMNVIPILNALTSLRGLVTSAAPGSEVFTWDINLIQRFNLNEMPEEIKLGDGTNIAPALTWAKKEGFTDCILYSDFMTPLYSLEASIKELDNVYAINVNSTSKKDKLLQKVFLHCKELLNLTN